MKKMESLYVERCLKAHFTNYSWKVVFDESDGDREHRMLMEKKESISAASRWRNRSNIIVLNPNHCRKYATRKQHRIKKQVYLDDVFDIDWLRPNVVCVCVRARCICTLVTFFASSNVHFLWVCCAFCYILFYFFILSFSFVCLSSAPFLMHL